MDRLWLLFVCVTFAGCMSSRHSDALESIARFGENRGSISDSSDQPALIENATLDDLVNAGLSRSNRLRSLYEEIQALNAALAYKGAIPEPMIGYTYDVFPVETRNGPILHMFMFSQKVPWTSELEAIGEEQSLMVEALCERFEVERNGFVADVAEAYLAYCYEDASRDFTSLAIGLLRDMREVATRRMETGSSNLADVLRIESEIDTLDVSLRAIEDRQRALLARLSSLTGVDKLTLSVDLPELPEALPSESELADKVSVAPTVRMAEVQVKAAEAGLDLAESSYYPDVTFSLGYSVIGEHDRVMGAIDKGRDVLSLGVQMNLPLYFWQNEGRTSEARSMMESKRASLSQTVLDVGAKLSMLFASVSDARRRVELYENSVVPNAEQTRDLLESSWTTSGAQFIDLLLAERALLQARLSLAKAKKDFHTDFYRLQALLGI
ncbi:MAG: TolC family protein [Planctomycetes bacterium]|nr:TolC family protein [Planctomycetota bacterium]